MKLLQAVVPSLLLAAAASALAPQEARKPPAAGAPAAADGKHDEADTPLMIEMEKIEHAEHFLRRHSGDATKDAESLQQIDLAQRAICAAKLLSPKMAANVPEAERPKFLAEFRKTMAQLLIEFATLEKSLLDGDREACKAGCKKLHGMEEDGHAEFTDGE
jgi:hypothetical protein